MALAEFKLKNINQKLTVFVGGSIALALTILGIIAVSYTSNLASRTGRRRGLANARGQRAGDPTVFSPNGRES